MSSMPDTLEAKRKAAEKCLTECPFRGMFTDYIDSSVRLIQDSINNPKITDINQINYARGCIAQLRNILKIPETIIRIADSKQVTQERKKVSHKDTKKKEIGV